MDMQLNWRKAPLSERWMADTPVGLITIAQRRAGKGRGYVWTAMLADGRRLASDPDRRECTRAAEANIQRLFLEAEKKP